MYSNAVLELQARQVELCVELMENEGDENTRRAYDQTVVALLNALGEDAPAGDVDFAEFERFAELYEAEVGRRPNIYKYNEMRDWMEDK